MNFHGLNTTQGRGLAKASAAVLLAGVIAGVYGAQTTHPQSALNLKLDEQPLARGMYEPASYSDVVSRVSPSVVKITVREKAHRVLDGRQAPGFDDPLLRQFFGGRMPQVQESPSMGLGSGVIVSPDGYIVTNNHVVDGAETVTVTVASGREYSAHVIGRDPQTDIAVVKIEGHDLPAITFAESSKIKVGDRVLAIGNPFGIGETVTSGIVSATGRRVGILDDVKGYENFIQTDAAINPGNSGGALVDLQGRLIGVNTAILSRSGGFQGVGLAVPSDMVGHVAESLVSTGHVVRGYLGLNIQTLTPALEDSFNLGTIQGGALVAEVVPDGPAARAGIKAGDVITALRGEPVTDSNGLALAVSANPPGTKLDLDLIRDGKTVHVVATTATRPDLTQGGAEAFASSDDQGVLNGVQVADIDGNARQEFNIPRVLQGALITQVDPNSASARAGISAGDVILDINRHPVRSAQDAVDLSSKVEGKKTLVRLWSHGATLYVVVDESQPDQPAS